MKMVMDLMKGKKVAEDPSSLERHLYEEDDNG